MIASSCHMLILALALSSSVFQLVSSLTYEPRHFVVHNKPDCSDYGQIDTVGEDFMLAPQFWVNDPTDACFYFAEPHEPQGLLWASFLYEATPDFSEVHLAWYYPADYCVLGDYANTLVVTYDLEVEAPNITCAPAVMKEFHAGVGSSNIVYITIIEPTQGELSSTGGSTPQEVIHSASAMDPITTCLIIAFTIVGVMAVAAACYVWRWKQVQTWENDNQQRLMSTRFQMT